MIHRVPISSHNGYVLPLSDYDNLTIVIIYLINHHLLNKLIIAHPLTNDWNNKLQLNMLKCYNYLKYYIVDYN